MDRFVSFVVLLLLFLFLLIFSNCDEEKQHLKIVMLDLCRKGKT
jgi:hypothetical protein